jgi:hypothetical protein
MRKYFIEVSGNGSECFVFDITDNQREKLTNMNKDINTLDVDDILDLVEEDSLYDCGHFYVGPHTTTNSFTITVKDENGKKIWRSPNNWNIPEECIELMCNSKNTLIVDGKSKGFFYDYAIELEGEFEEEKLSVIVTDIGGKVQVISDITYEDFSLNTYKEYGDYNTKEYSYTLI